MVPGRSSWTSGLLVEGTKTLVLEPSMRAGYRVEGGERAVGNRQRRCWMEAYINPSHRREILDEARLCTYNAQSRCTRARAPRRSMPAHTATFHPRGKQTRPDDRVRSPPRSLRTPTAHRSTRPTSLVLGEQAGSCDGLLRRTRGRDSSCTHRREHRAASMRQRSNAGTHQSCEPRLAICALCACKSRRLDAIVAVCERTVWARRCRR